MARIMTATVRKGGKVHHLVDDMLACDRRKPLDGAQFREVDDGDPLLPWCRICESSQWRGQRDRIRRRRARLAAEADPSAGITRDHVLAQVGRALRAQLPDEAERILRAIERGWDESRMLPHGWRVEGDVVTTPRGSLMSLSHEEGTAPMAEDRSAGYLAGDGHGYDP